MTAYDRKPTLLRAFIENEAAGGIILMVAAVLAMLAANSPLASVYFSTLAAYVGPLSVLHWINDALMAVFFCWLDWRSSVRFRPR